MRTTNSLNDERKRNSIQNLASCYRKEEAHRRLRQTRNSNNAAILFCMKRGCEKRQCV